MRGALPPELRGLWGLWERIPGALVAAALSCGLTAAIFAAGTYRLTVGSHGFRGTGDDHVYLYMTTHPVGSFHIAPWCWRIGIPALVRYLPVSPQAGYEAVALTSVAVTGLLVYLIARTWGCARWLSLAGLLLFFSFGYAAKFNLKDFWLTDAPAFAFASAAILALQCRRKYLFAACLLAGVFAKESVIFVAPLAYTFWARQRLDWRALARAGALALPAVAALLALRAGIGSLNSDHAYVASLPQAVRSDIGNLPSYDVLAVASQTLAARSHTWLRTAGYTVSSFGLLPMVLAPLGWRDLKPVAVRFWPLAALDLLQLVFALNTQRLVVFAFVPVIIACLAGARRMVRRFGVSRGWFALAAALAVGLEFAQPAQSSPTPPVQAGALGALCVVAAAITLWTASRRWLMAGGTPGTPPQRLRCDDRSLRG
jgi:hypothetical protein